MIKRFFTRIVPLAFLATGVFTNAGAQTTQISTAYTNGPGHAIFLVPGPQFITFAVTNNNPCPIAITEIDNYHVGAATINIPPTINFSQNGATYTLWYNPNPAQRNGGPNISLTSGWLIAGSGNAVSNGASAGSVINVISGMNLVIPPGATYRLALSLSDTFVGTVNPTPAAFASGGVTLISYDGTNAYTGSMPGTGTNALNYAFEGNIRFINAGAAPPAPPALSATNATVCPCDSTVLTATVPSYITNPIFTFYKPDGTLHKASSSNKDTLNFCKDATLKGGDWSVTVTDPSCGNLTSAKAFITITQVIPAAPKISGKQEYCLNEFFTPVTVLTTGVEKWYYGPSGGSPIPFVPSFNTTWAHKDTFYVSQTISGCESKDRTMVVYSAAPKPAPPIASTPVFYCENSPSFPLNATGENLKWWYEPIGGLPSTIAPTPNTTAKDTFYYWVSQTKDGCESSRQPVTAIVTFRPNGLILISKKQLCQEDTMTVAYYGSAFPGSAYNWTFPNGTQILGGGFWGPIFLKLDSAGLQPIKLQVGNSNCYGEMVSQTIIVDTFPTATINARPNACLGQTELISLSDYTLSTDSFFWDFNGGITTHYSTDQGPYGVYWDYPGKMVISLKMKNKTCYNTVYDTVVVRKRPDASFKAEGYGYGAQICTGDSILMTPNTIDANSSFSWLPARFFDNYSKQAVTHARIDFSGFVTLNVVDAYGCMNSDSMYMNTKPCCDVYMPTAFSPNNDGLNDLFRIVPTSARSPKGVERNIELRSFKVMNRWGHVVFETANQRTGWDGTINGKPQDPGTYFYYINFKCDGKIVEQKGEVILVK